MPGKIVLDPLIQRRDLRLHREILFAFGDNIQRYGMGGQASEMRGEPNAVGIPTKWSPFTSIEAYFIDNDLQNAKVRREIDAAFTRLSTHLELDQTIVLPKSGIGTGRAQLFQRAPLILKYIEDNVIKLYKITERKPILMVIQ